MHDLVNHPVKGPWGDVECSPEVVWAVILQGAKHMVKRCKASWEGLSRHLIALSIHQCHLTLNPAVMEVDSILLIHTFQLIIGPFIL